MSVVTALKDIIILDIWRSNIQHQIPNTYTAYIVKKIKINGYRKICILQAKANYLVILQQ